MSETASLERRVRGVLRAAGHPELADEGRGAGWRIVAPGWHVFAYQGAVRVDWWSEATLGPDPAAREQDREKLASLRLALETAGLAVTAPDASVLEVQEAPASGTGRSPGATVSEPGPPAGDGTGRPS